MTELTLYYLSRAILCIAFALFLAVTGMQAWLAAVMGLVSFGLFLWAPHSGRYAVHPELGVTAMRRDERTQGINDKAARNAFVIMALATAAIIIYTRSTGMDTIPAALVEANLVLSAIVYFVSDWFLRRA